MKTGIFYHKRTGSPVQIIARAQTKPTFQEVICYQELTKPYDHFVMEKRQFFAEYVRDFEELPLVERKQLEKREDLPDKRPLISKGEVTEKDSEREKTEETEKTEKTEETEETDSRIQRLIEFFDAPTYQEKIRLFENMKDELDDHMLNNIAVGMDLSIENGEDGYRLIMSELRIRNKYEGERGDRY